ncbi:MAG: L-fucose/L-arabinose isomerase family protein [Solirubrobacteraceae bacterium]
MTDVRGKIGVFGIGLEAYWPQFDGLEARCAGYQSQVEANVAGLGAEVISAGLVDTVEKARAAGDLFAREQVDLILCHVVTYATSATVLPAVQAAKVPVVLLGLQPTRTLDYESIDTAEWLANCAACSVPELAGAFTRARVPYDSVAGTIDDDPRAWSKIGAWVRAAGVARAIRTSRIGFLGHVYNGMLDMASDFTMFHGQLGAHVEVLEMDDLAVRVERATAEEIAAKRVEIDDMFATADASSDPIAVPIEDDQLEWSSRVAVGLDHLVADFGLDALTYDYRGLDGNLQERLGAGVIVGNSLLTARGVPTSGEADLKTNVAQLILDRLGAGGSFTEYYALDLDEDFVLMGHDGPGHLAIAAEQPTLRSLKVFHGKRGAGLSVEFKVQQGPVTILGCTQTADGRLKFIAAEGESIPGPTFRIGNTNSRLRFGLRPAEFLEGWSAEGPTHHVALGVGHRIDEIERVCQLLGVPFAVVGDRGGRPAAGAPDDALATPALAGQGWGVA